MDLDLTLNFDWDTEWQLRQSHSTASMCTALWPEHADDQIGEAVNDCGLLVETRRRVDHTEDPRPAALQASENCQTSKPCSDVRLFFGDFDADLAKGLSQAAVRVVGPWPEMMARDPTIRTQGKGRVTPGGSFNGCGKA
jgi:hypothetical protein